MEISESSRVFESNNDVLMEILVRLPPKSVFKFTCVSKRWKNLVMDPSFFKLYDKQNRCDGVKLLGFVQSDMRMNCCFQRKYWKQSCLPAVKSKELELGLEGGRFFPDIKRGYFLASSNNGLILWGCVPCSLRCAEYIVGNPIAKTWLTLPPPPRVKKTNSVSVALTSKDDFSEGFRVIVVTKSDEIFNNRGDILPMPIDTYSSRKRQWRSLELLSSRPVELMDSTPPTVSQGFLHWFTMEGYCLTYDSSLLDKEDDSDGDIESVNKKNKNKKTKKKQHVSEIIDLPVLAGHKIIWRTDNGQTLWFGICNVECNLEIFRKYNDDEWVSVNKVEDMHLFTKNLIQISSEELEEMEIPEHLDPHLQHNKAVRSAFLLEAFVPWDPRLVFVRFMETIFIYDWENKKIDELLLDLSSNYFTDAHETLWLPYFHSLALSSYRSP